MSRSEFLGLALKWLLIAVVIGALVAHVAPVPWYHDRHTIIIFGAAVLLSILLEAVMALFRRHASSTAALFTWHLVLHILPIMLFTGALHSAWLKETTFYGVLGIWGAMSSWRSMRHDRAVPSQKSALSILPAIGHATVKPFECVASQAPTRSAAATRHFKNPFWNEEDRDRRMARKLRSEYMTALVAMIIAAILFLILIVILPGATFYSINLFAGLMGLNIYAIWRQYAYAEGAMFKISMIRKATRPRKTGDAAWLRIVSVICFISCVAVDIFIWFILFPPGAYRDAAISILGTMAGICLAFWFEVESKIQDNRKERS